MSDGSAQPLHAATKPEAWDQRSVFSVSRRHVAGATCVTLSGELDLGTAPVADAELRRAQQEAGDVVLDIRALGFIDVCGLNMILAAATRARQDGGRMVVLHGSPCVSRLFELTGVEGTLETTTDPAVAGVLAEHNGARPGGLSQHFRWDVVSENAHVRIVPAGELDMASTPKLEQAIGELRETGVAYLIVDLRRVTFIDSAGLHLAVDLAADAKADSLRLELLPGPPEVQRIFDVTGTLDQLPFVTPDPRR